LVQRDGPPPDAYEQLQASVKLRASVAHPALHSFDQDYGANVGFALVDADRLLLPKLGQIL
jgi:hypothetical protein